MLTFLTQAAHAVTAVATKTHGAVATTKHTAVKAYSHAETLAHHLNDAVLWHFSINGVQLDITKRVVMMWLVSFLLLVILVPVARKLAKSPFSKPSRLSGFVEVLVKFIRHDVGYGSMGSAHKHYDGFFLSLFFFILFGNLMGLVPSFTELFQTVGEMFGYLATSHGHDMTHAPILTKVWPSIAFTGDINVTATLAFFVFIVLVSSGFAFQGPAFIKNIVPRGIPALLWLIMWPIEVVSLIIKPVALSIRLLANMTAGHMIIIVLIGFIFQFASWGVVPLSIVGSMAIYFLEIFVAFLQAYIFVFLSALFIGQVQHRH